MEHITVFISEYLHGFYVPTLRFTDVVEIFIIAIFFYRLMLWIRDTKAWMLLKGILVIVGFMVIAILFNMQTILYIAQNSLSVLAMAAVVVFQPEIRRALENLGQKGIISNLIPFDKKRESDKYQDTMIQQLIEACMAMSKEKTGALIVIEDQVRLNEYAETGIEMDCKISSQILCNVFEHNTPLHDGAIILRGDRIVAATCYLPLSENMSLNKNLGTRHRAAVGISEISDAVVIVVSEETGKISVSHHGKIYGDISEAKLREQLQKLNHIDDEVLNVNIFGKLIGGDKNEKIDPS